MSAYAHVHRLTRLRFDGRAFALIWLFWIVLMGGTLLAFVLLSIDAGSPDPSLGAHSPMNSVSSSTQMLGGVGWAVSEAAFAIGLLGLIALVRRAPELLKKLIISAERPAIWMLVAAFSISIGRLWIAFIVLIAVSLANELDLWWAVNDVLAVLIAIGAAASVGVVLGPVFIAIGLIGLSVYDYALADRRTDMFELASWTMRHKLPLLFIVPDTPRLSWSRISNEVSSEGDLAGWGIGTADLLLPVAFIVALVSLRAADLIIGGAVGGLLISCFRLSHKMDRGAEEGHGGAGLPALTTGVLGGWTVGAAAAFAIATLGVTYPW